MKDLRKNYTKDALLEANLPSQPFTLFEEWFAAAVAEPLIAEANAMVLSTVHNNAVDSRVVLLKDLRESHFVFFTNYSSHKGIQLEKNVNCTILFPWIAQERQVIVRGKASKISEQESSEYFDSRPKGSQIGAWVSEQSSEIASREDLDAKLDFYLQKFKNEVIPKPNHWGGYEIKPVEIEFWQGRENRLHDRILYCFENNSWSIKRLQP
ncbi:MAG: pyridoxamine 5'-phosphate oxidase [Bacteroidia bacterium]